MKILINAVSSARHPSGICRHAAALALSLAKRVEVAKITLLVGRWQEPYFRNIFQLRELKLEIFSVDISDSPIDRNLWYLQALPKTAKKHSPDIVHLSFPIPILRSRFSCPVIASLHDLYPYDAPDNFGFPRVVFNRLFLRQCLGSSDAIVCGSDFTLSRLRSLEPRIAAAKALRIYQCVESDAANMRQPLFTEVGGRPFFLSVAQHRRNKNLALLINAFAELLERGGLERDTCLLVVGGEGPETLRLKNLVRQRLLNERVYFKTLVTDPELSWLYANCAIFLAPSAIEGFGIPVVEALRHGCRIVCSDIPVFREIAGTGCHYFNLQNESPMTALADAVETALRYQPKQSQMLDRFSAKEIVGQYVSLYSEVLDRASRREPVGSVASLNRTVRYDKVAS